MLRTPFCRLLRFKRYSDDAGNIAGLKDDPPVLVVAPLSGHHATLLRDTVRTLLRDHKVYITDWIDARMVPASDGAFTLDDYVATIQRFIRQIGADNLHVISVCQPTVPVLAAVSLMAARGEATPRSLVMMGGPIDTRESPTPVNNLATQKPLWWFENNVIHQVPANYPGRGRRVYPGFLQHAGFMAMNPERHFSRTGITTRTWSRATSTTPRRTVVSTTNTTPCSTCPPSTTSIPCAWCSSSTCCREGCGTSPASASIRRGSRAPRCSRSKASSTTSPARARPAPHIRCVPASPSRIAQHMTVEGAGHYGIFSGRRWRTQVYPQVRGVHREARGSKYVIGERAAMQRPDGSFRRAFVD